MVTEAGSELHTDTADRLGIHHGVADSFHDRGKPEAPLLALGKTKNDKIEE